jgi:hypothetical protein
MAITAVVNTSAASTVIVKPASKYEAVVTVAPSANITLSTLVNVDTSGAEDGEALVYDAANNNYVIREITFNSNNITNINGGAF